jgi:hypothetical protein
MLIAQRVFEKHRSNPPSPLKKGEKESKSPFLRAGLIYRGEKMIMEKGIELEY